LSIRRPRKKRNLSGYERVGVVTDVEAREMLALARRLRDDVLIWMRANHASLLAD
jgi:hypothetical protein